MCICMMVAVYNPAVSNISNHTHIIEAAMKVRGMRPVSFILGKHEYEYSKLREVKTLAYWRSVSADERA